MWPAVLIQEDREYPCTILDISEMGAKVEAPNVRFQPSMVRLQCDRFGNLEAWLLWSRGSKAGLRFDLPQAEIMQLLKPIVPGLDRREKPASAPRAELLPRAGFGRLPRGKPSNPVETKT